MAGLVTYGAYIPLHRLRRDDIARAWGSAPPGGERAVANSDEDPITMAQAAAIDCLGDIDRDSIDGVYLATTSSPYKEKQAATVVARSLNLRRDVATMDFTDTLRSGTLALRAALDAVGAGSAQRVLVLAADCRLGAPRSELEQILGDGAAALLVGGDDVAATVEASHTHSNELIDLWRSSRDNFVNSWEDRFVITEGFLLNMQEGVSQLLKKSELKVQDVTKAALYAPDARRHREIAASLGLDPKTQVQDPMFDRVGNTGAAFALMLLVAALEEAKDGDRILVANYGDGADSFILRATPQIEKIKDRQGIRKNLASKRYLASYETYITHRGLMDTEGQRRPPMVSSAPVLWRDQKWVLGLNGSHCQSCGRTFFPPQRICVHCRSKDNFDYVPLAGRKGTLFTFNKDALALSADPPEIWCRVHLEGDVGVYCRMTDRDPDRVELEMPVEMTFRKFHDAGGYPNYFWKCRPTRESFIEAGEGI